MAPPSLPGQLGSQTNKARSTEEWPWGISWDQGPAAQEGTGAMAWHPHQVGPGSWDPQEGKRHPLTFRRSLRAVCLSETLVGGGGVTVPALPSAQGRGARVCTTWERVPHAAHGPPQCLRYVGGLHQGQRSASLTQAQVQGWHPGQGTEPGAAAFQSGRQAAGSTCAENTHTWGRQCGRRWAVTLRAQLPTQRVWERSSRGGARA